MADQAEPYLSLELDGQVIQQFSLDKTRTSIGRARDSEIQIAVRGVSRMHAVVIRDQDGNCVVRDLGSANGTYVNGVKIGGEHRLEVGDVINFLDYALCFRRLLSNEEKTGPIVFGDTSSSTFGAEASLPTVEGPAPRLSTQKLAAAAGGEGAGFFEIEIRDAVLGVRSFSIDRAVTVIGGEEGSELRVSGSRLEKIHSLLIVVEQMLLFVRVSSANLARVNGAPRQVCYLQVGDEIAIGNSKLIVRHT